MSSSEPTFDFLSFYPPSSGNFRFDIVLPVGMKIELWCRDSPFKSVQHLLKPLQEKGE